MQLPPRALLSYRKRVNKLNCERLAVRLATETGSTALDGLDFDEVGYMGTYGPSAVDVSLRHP